MKHIEGNFTGLGGLNIYTQTWLPDGDPRAVILLVHGYGEHSGRYGNLVDWFLPRGYAIYALDHRGHGKSDGERVHIDSFTDYLVDLETYRRIVREAQPGGKHFLLGHSMGAMIAIAYAPAHQDDFDGLIISGGGIATAQTPPMPQNIDLAATVSRDPAVVQAYRDDPLVYHGSPPAGRAAASKATRERLPELARSIAMPVLIMAGEASPLGDGARARALFETVSSVDKALRLYPELYHEIFNEPEHPVVMADLEAWLAARTTSA